MTAKVNKKEIKSSKKIRKQIPATEAIIADCPNCNSTLNLTDPDSICLIKQKPFKFDDDVNQLIDDARKLTHELENFKLDVLVKDIGLVMTFIIEDVTDIVNGCFYICIDSIKLAKNANAAQKAWFKFINESTGLFDDTYWLDDNDRFMKKHIYSSSEYKQILKSVMSIDKRVHEYEGKMVDLISQAIWKK